MNIDKIINIIREQNLKVGRKLPADLPGMGGGGGGTNVLTSQAKVRTLGAILSDPSGRKAAKKFKNDPQTKLDEMMGAGAAGFTGSADPKGPVAGFDPVMKGPIRRKPCLGKGKMPGLRTRWRTGQV